MGAPWEKYKPKKMASGALGPWNKYEVGEPPAEDSHSQELAEPEDPKSVVAKHLLGLGAKGLGYAGGLLRTGAAGIANIPYSLATGKSLTKEDDALKALKGDAPGVSEYLERAGVPEGPHANLFPEVTVPGLNLKLGEGDTSARDFGGFVGDAALDPLSYVAAEAKPVGELVESGGKKVYKSALKKVDERLVEKNTKPLSDVLIENGAPVGSAKGLAKKADKIKEGLLKERGDIYGKINDSGNKVDVLKAMDSSIDKGQGLLRKYPAADEQIADLETWLLKHGKQGDQIPVDLASDWKSGLYDSLPQSAFDPHGRAVPIAKDYQKAFARGLKQEIEAAGERAEPGLGKRVESINEDVGSLIQSKKPSLNEIRKENTKNWVSSVDGMGAGMAAASPHVGVPILAAKKLADLSKTSLFRTAAGRGLIDLGKSGLVDAATARGLIDALVPDYSGRDSGVDDDDNIKRELSAKKKDKNRKPASE
jgi:hypothetical protein